MSSGPVLEPDDEFNQRLRHHVHPPDWENPTPSGPYDLVVIGGGHHRGAE